MVRRVQARASKHRFVGQESCRASELQARASECSFAGTVAGQSMQVQLAGQENCRPVGASEVGRKQDVDDTV